MFFTDTINHIHVLHMLTRPSLPGDCVIHPALESRLYSCSSTYSWEKEDEGNYLAGWTTTNDSVSEVLSKNEKSAWVWRSAWDLKGTPYWGIFATYWGGGYVANVDPSRLQTIEEMQSLELETWIDRYTRAIFTEFALYNAYTNFFCVITILSEIIPTGGYNHYVQFKPVRLYRYTGPETYVLMAFEIVYIICLFMFTYSEFKELFRRKRKYFEDPWNYIEILVIILSFTTIGLFFARLAFGKFAISRMNKHPRDFISFTYVLLLDECQIATLGYAVFFAILKSLRLLRFNRRMSLLTLTVKACAGPLMSFFLVFFVVFFAYVQFAFIVFGSTEETYSSFQTCVATMMTMTLGGFDFETLANVNRVLGPLFFFTYMIFVFMIMVNVFLAIINDTLAEVSSDVALQSNDYEIMDFVFHQIKMVAGVRVEPAVKPLYKKKKTQFQLDVDSIESLSENIEYALVNTLVEDQRQTNWLKPENMTRKKVILLQEVLRQNLDYNEDDLANLIPLMEQFLIKHNDRDVARIITGSDDIYDVTSLDDINLRERSSTVSDNPSHLIVGHPLESDIFYQSERASTECHTDSSDSSSFDSQESDIQSQDEEEEANEDTTNSEHSNSELVECEAEDGKLVESEIVSIKDDISHCSNATHTPSIASNESIAE